MKLHVMSDLHTEFWNDEHQKRWFYDLIDIKIEKDKPDAVILAGDIFLLREESNVRPVVKEFVNRYPEVYYVPGNHEFFGTSIAEGLELLKNIDETNHNFNLILPGLHYANGISGGTLWFKASYEWFKDTWIDYRLIKDSKDSIKDQHTRFLKAKPWEHDIVISHHFPTEESIAEEYRASDINGFFCAGIESELTNVNARLWVHGHTHKPMDYISKYGFRVYCNPYGYPHEVDNPNFFERLLVQI